MFKAALKEVSYYLAQPQTHQMGVGRKGPVILAAVQTVKRCEHCSRVKSSLSLASSAPTTALTAQFACVALRNTVPTFCDGPIIA